MCTRTVYCTNIDKKVFVHFFILRFFLLMVGIKWPTKFTWYYFLAQVIQADVKSFFETKCGLVCKENQTKKLHKACLKMYDVITLVVGFWGITHTPPELHLWNSTWYVHFCSCKSAVGCVSHSDSCFHTFFYNQPAVSFKTMYFIHCLINQNIQQYHISNQNIS